MTKIGKLGVRRFAVALSAGVAALAMASPSWADGWKHRHKHHDRDWGGVHFSYYPAYPIYVYPPAPVYVAPPPPPVYMQPVPVYERPSLSFVFPIRID
jgi:hypothetical protein